MGDFRTFSLIDLTGDVSWLGMIVPSKDLLFGDDLLGDKLLRVDLVREDMLGGDEMLGLNVDELLRATCRGGVLGSRCLTVMVSKS